MSGRKPKRDGEALPAGTTSSPSLTHPLPFSSNPASTSGGTSDLAQTFELARRAEEAFAASDFASARDLHLAAKQRVEQAFRSVQYTGDEFTANALELMIAFHKEKVADSKQRLAAAASASGAPPDAPGTRAALVRASSGSSLSPALRLTLAKKPGEGAVHQTAAGANASPGSEGGPRGGEAVALDALVGGISEYWKGMVDLGATLKQESARLGAVANSMAGSMMSSMILPSSNDARPVSPGLAGPVAAKAKPPARAARPKELVPLALAEEKPGTAPLPAATIASPMNLYRQSSTTSISASMVIDGREPYLLVDPPGPPPGAGLWSPTASSHRASGASGNDIRSLKKSIRDSEERYAKLERENSELREKSLKQRDKFWRLFVGLKTHLDEYVEELAAVSTHERRESTLKLAAEIERVVDENPIVREAFRKKTSSSASAGPKTL